jgi:group I intron endonuclease
MTCGIYKLISPNNKIYIGQSIKIEQRWIDHKRRAKKNSTRHSFKLYNSIRKYGWENFKKEIVEVCDPDELNDREIYYINLYDSINFGLNGRGGGNNWKMTSDTKNKLRIANLGKYNGDQNIEFYIDNVKYKSIGDASKALQIPPKTIHNRLNSNNIKYSNYIYIDNIKNVERKKSLSGKHNEKKIMIDNIIYNTIAEACKILCIPRSTLHYRLKKGIYKIVD